MNLDQNAGPKELEHILNVALYTSSEKHQSLRCDADLNPTFVTPAQKLAAPILHVGYKFAPVSCQR